MRISEVKKYLVEKKLFKNPRIKKLGQGNNYDVFLVEENNCKYTFRTSRTDVVTENKLQNEYDVLKFLDYSGIEFCQKPIFFDKEKLISILSFAPGIELGINKLSGKNLEKFVEQLIKLHALKYSDYIKYSKKFKITPTKPEKPIDNLKIKGLDRYKYLLKNCEDKKVMEWIKPKIKEARSAVLKIKCTKNNLIFNHCDLGGANIILDQKNIYFIDWEQAKFVYHSDFWLGHIFIRCRTSTEAKQQEITRIYAKKTGQNIKILETKIKERMKIAKLTDLIWAVKMYTELKKKGYKNWKRYEELAKEVMAEYNKKFSS